MPFEGVTIGAVISTLTFFIGRINADICQKKIEQPVVVKIKKHRPGRMAHVSETGFHGDIFKLAVSEIFKKDIAHLYRGYEQIRQAIVVNVGKGRAGANAILQAHTRARRNILEFPVAQIAPKLITPELIDEIE